MENVPSREEKFEKHGKQYEIEAKRNRLRRAGLIVGGIAVIIIIVFFTPVVLLGEPGGVELFVYLILPLAYIVSSIIIARKQGLIGGIMLLIASLFTISILLLNITDWSWWFIIFWTVFYILPLLIASSLFLLSWQVMRVNSGK
jgi:hypothetical protein